MEGQSDYDKVRDYCLLLLGAPVIKIELDDQQIRLAYDEAVDVVRISPMCEGQCDDFRLTWVRYVMLTRCMLILATLWTKFDGPTSKGGELLFQRATARVGVINQRLGFNM